MLDYANLSRHERKAAAKLARQLLRTVPAAQEPDEPRSIRGALSTAFMKPRNIIGAVVYTDGSGNYWGDVILKKGKKTCQMGTAEGAPLQSPEVALDQVKELIASIKAMREHPIVQGFRDDGVDPELVELLRVRHEEFGCRWVLLNEEQIRIGSEAFAKYVEGKFPGMADKPEQARIVILQMAPRFATHPVFLLSPDNEQEAVVRLFRSAAAFLLRTGIINVDQVATKTNLYLANETMSEERTVKWLH
jgi:hypothetical protein